MLICFRCSEPIINDYSYGLHRDCFFSWFNLSDSTSEFEEVIFKKAKDDVSLPPIHTSFFQGMFKKYSAKLENHAYILKVQDDDYPELPATEYLSNQIARRLGLLVPEFYLIRFPNEHDAKTAFVVSNFMGKYTPANLIHIHRFINSDKPYSCRTILGVLKDKIGRIDALEQFVFLCLFDALIGNHDRHGRNIAFIETKKGYELAPFYDNPSYIGIEEESLLSAKHSPRGKIITSLSEEPTIKDYVAEFKAMGYEALIKKFRNLAMKANLSEMVNRGFLSDKRKNAFNALIQQRLEELQNATS